MTGAIYKARRDVIEMNVYTEKLLALDPENWYGHLQKGIYLFVANRDIAVALRESYLANNNDGIWLFNVAFLHGYSGELDEADLKLP